MTEQADLKARLLTLDAFTITDGAGANVALDLIEQAVSRITDLEAERDEISAWLNGEDAPTDDDGNAKLSLIGRIAANKDEWRDAALDADRICREWQALNVSLEGRLALAEKVVEAGRRWVLARQVALTLTDKLPSDDFKQAWHELGESEWAMSAALTAYAENTSSNDLTTGEDDA